jgi:hypothetical protein
MLKVVSASAGVAVAGLLSLPLHQQVVLCALVRLPADQVAVSLVRCEEKKRQKSPSFKLNKNCRQLHSEYVRMMRAQDMDPLTRADFTNIVDLTKDTGFVSVAKRGAAEIKVWLVCLFVFLVFGLFFVFVFLLFFFFFWFVLLVIHRRLTRIINHGADCVAVEQGRCTCDPQRCSPVLRLAPSTTAAHVAHIALTDTSSNFKVKNDIHVLLFSIMAIKHIGFLQILFCGFI